MNAIISYEHFRLMGITYHPRHIRMLVKRKKFPQPIKGGGRNGTPTVGPNGKLHWRQVDVEKWIKARKSPRQ